MKGDRHFSFLSIINQQNHLDSDENQKDSHYLRVVNTLKPSEALIIEGFPKGDRFSIYFNGNYILLTLKSFTYLSHLAAHAVNHPNEFLDRNTIEPGDNFNKYMYNLRNELEPPLKNTRKLIENNRSGGFRLNLHPSQIVVLGYWIPQLPDESLKSILSDLAGLPKSTTS